MDACSACSDCNSSGGYSSDCGSSGGGGGDSSPSGCVIAGVFALLVAGVFMVFPWSRNVPITPFPNLNGILVSAGITLLGIVLLVVLGALVYALRDVFRFLGKALAYMVGIMLAIAIIGIVALIALAILSEIFRWLFARY